MVPVMVTYGADLRVFVTRVTIRRRGARPNLLWTRPIV